MNIQHFIEGLLDELSVRIDEGVPNLKNPKHLQVLSEIFDELELYSVGDQLIENLMREDEDDEYSHIGAGIYVAKRDVDPDGGARKGAKKYRKDGEGEQATYTAISDKEAEEIKQAQGDAGEKAAAAYNQQQAKDGVDGGDQGDGEEEQPQGKPVKGASEFSHAPDIAQDKDEEETDDGDSNQVTDSTTDEEKEEFNKSLNASISELREKRRTGEAGAGGAAASFGESVYSDNVTSLDLDKFKKENEKEIQAEVENLKTKKLNKEQNLVLENMGLKPPPDKEGLEYLAARKVFFNQQLEKATAEKDHVYNQDPRVKKSFESWMNAAFDGAVSTRELLEEGDEIDTSRPYTCVQSDPSVDKKVLSELEKRRDNAKSDEERKHYEREIYFFKKSGTYHDTYVVGEDSKGRMTIVSVTNKAASNLKDPHNNTTPAARLAVLKGKYDEKTQKLVVGVIKEGIERVTKVTQDTKNNSAKIEVDEPFAKLARIAAPKYFEEIDKRGSNRKKTKAGGPAKGAEFGHFLDEEGVSVQDWNSMSDVDKIKLVQKYNVNNDVAYDPYSKLFIKVGEVDTGGHNQLLKVRAEAEKQGIDLNASNIKEAGDIKRNEQGAVKETHEKVVKTIYDSDKEAGYPKTDGNGNVVENGPAARAYIDTVLDALHFTSYIDFDDKDDGKLIAQMGIRGAKPSDIRKCLGDLSGYGDIPPGTREGLKEYLRNTSTIDAESGAIIIKSKKNGRDTQLAEDTWRTAGTSQKVASSFGKDMQECVGAKVDERRSNKE